jgi:hypothetical protein
MRAAQVFVPLSIRLGLIVYVVMFIETLAAEHIPWQYYQ